MGVGWRYPIFPVLLINSRVQFGLFIVLMRWLPRRSIMVMAIYIYISASVFWSPRLSCLFTLAVFWVHHQNATGKSWLDSSLPTYPLYLISGVPTSQEETAKLATQSSVWSANWSCKIYPSRVSMENLCSLEEEIRWIHMLLLWYLIVSSSDFVL